MNVQDRLSAKDRPDLSSFSWDDPFLMDRQLEDEERMVRDSAAAYASEKLAPRVIAAYRERWARWAFSGSRCQSNMAGSARIM